MNSGLHCDLCISGTYLGDHWSPALWLLSPLTAWFHWDEWIFLLEILIQLDAQDDDGLGWSTLADARDASRVRIGSMLLAGNRYGQAVVRVMAVDDDGQVHFSILPGPVAKNRHLLDRTVA